jgi:hypothetical protein
MLLVHFARAWSNPKRSSGGERTGSDREFRISGAAPAGMVTGSAPHRPGPASARGAGAQPRAAVLDAPRRFGARQSRRFDAYSPSQRRLFARVDHRLYLRELEALVRSTVRSMPRAEAVLALGLAAPGDADEARVRARRRGSEEAEDEAEDLVRQMESEYRFHKINYGDWRRTWLVLSG